MFGFYCFGASYFAQVPFGPTEYRVPWRGTPYRRTNHALLSWPIDGAHR